jgi:hypothetical protein
MRAVEDVGRVRGLTTRLMAERLARRAFTRPPSLAPRSGSRWWGMGERAACAYGRAAGLMVGASPRGTSALWPCERRPRQPA